MFDDIGKCLDGIVLILIISVPLGIWKLVEIVIWLFHHIKII